MLGHSRQICVYAAPHPVDMRKSYDGLFAIARDVLGHNPLNGHVFLFVSKGRKRAKVLLWDGTGLCIYQKRLEKGRFIAPWDRPRDAHGITMTQSELQLFLEGSTHVRHVLSPKTFQCDA
jgi:transposase